MLRSLPLAVWLASLAISPMTAQTQASAPFKAGDNYFFTARDGALYVRDGIRGSARKLLQANAFEKLAPSWDGKYLTYEMPAPGMTSHDVFILNVATAGVSAEVLHNAVISYAPWTANNKGFFYAREDTADHRQRVYYHRLGQPQQNDQIVYSRQDQPDWRYDARVSDDGQYAVFTISHPQDDKTRLYFIDLDDPGKPTLDAPAVKLVDEFGSHYAFIDNGGNSFFLQTDHMAPRGRIVLANTDITRESLWPAVLLEGGDTLQFARTVGEQYVIGVYRNGGRSTARVYSFPDQNRMREEMRRRADSVRRAGGDPNYRPRNRPMGSDTGRGGAMGIGMLAWRLELKREIPIPMGSVILDMHSVATDDVLFYTVKTEDGAISAYVYNVKNGRSTLFNTDPMVR
jgi:hypothetical protein